MYDLVILNGHVIDNETNVNEVMNIGITNGKIAVISKDMMEGKEVIDASNLYVVPGFIDLHMHEQDLEEFYTGINLDMLYMGVTTAVGGNCGSSHYDPIEFLEYATLHGAPINIGMLAGHGYFRNKIGATNKYEPISDEQLTKLAKEINNAVENGCLGVSYGIRYIPGITERELLETAKACVPSKKIIAAHVRDDAMYIFDSMKELMDIGKKLDIPVEISHIGSMGGFGQMKQCLELIDEYQNNGVDVNADCYPYYAFSTEIGETTYDEGFLERYQCDYNVIELSEGKYKGQRCTKEIFNELRKEAPDTITVAYVMKEEDVDLALTNPNIMLASDGLKNHGQGHPRACGTFPRLISQFVKKDKLSLHEAISKMTLMPAKKLQLSNKGRIQVGKDADITIFNYHTIEDQATFEHPEYKPKGIEYVIIDGQIALKQGNVMNNKLGKGIKQ